MAGLTDAQRLSFAKEILKIVRRNKSVLEEAGLPVDKKIEKLENELKIATEAEAEQQTLQSQAKKATETARKAISSCYGEASNDVEAVVGLLVP